MMTVQEFVTLMGGYKSVTSLIDTHEIKKSSYHDWKEVWRLADIDALEIAEQVRVTAPHVAEISGCKTWHQSDLYYTTRKSGQHLKMKQIKTCFQNLSYLFKISQGQFCVILILSLCTGLEIGEGLRVYKKIRRQYFEVNMPPSLLKMTHTNVSIPKRTENHWNTSVANELTKDMRTLKSKRRSGTAVLNLWYTN